MMPRGFRSGFTASLLAAGALAVTGLFLAGCATPQEKAMRRTMRDYQRTGQAAHAYAAEQEKLMVNAARAFHRNNGRWPFSSDELTGFANEHQLDFSGFAFLRLTFAVMPDGSAQVSYEVDATRFNTHEFRYQLPGSVRIPPPR